jgi:hypothetical protein
MAQKEEQTTQIENGGRDAKIFSYCQFMGSIKKSVLFSKNSFTGGAEEAVP